MTQKKTKATLVDTIYKEIRSDIAKRVLLPGEKLNIAELAERYGTSQTPVKLALSRLVSENIVENFPRQGMRIKQISLDEINEIFDMRLMLDLYMTKEIITTVSYNEDIRERMVRNVEENLQLIKSDDFQHSLDMYMRNYNLDLEFHELYLKCTGCKMILEMFNYINPLKYKNFVFRKQSREKNILGVEEHKQILDAILAEDEMLLRESVTAHITNAKRAIELIIKVNKII